MSHAARLEVDLSRLHDNARLMVNLVSPATLIAVVKSDGYGHGAAQAAQAFISGGAVGLAVSGVGEAVALRREGFDCPILTLTEPSAEDVPDIVEFRVGATIFTETRLKGIAEAAGHRVDPLPVHIKLDTGTRRAGCSPDTLPRLVAIARSLEQVTLKSVWSQFAAASDRGPTDTTVAALAVFRDALERTTLPTGVETHVANSAAAISMPESRMDVVRSGIALYGYSSRNDRSVSSRVGLAPALRLVAPVRSVRHVRAGEWAGYGSPQLLESDRAIANVGVGYAHGIPRTWGLSDGWVMIGGERYPILGPVSMEQMLIDLGDPSISRVTSGDEVVVLGDGETGPDAADIAAACDSIPNEILCRIGLSQTARVYAR